MLHPQLVGILNPNVYPPPLLSLAHYLAHCVVTSLIPSQLFATTYVANILVMVSIQYVNSILPLVSAHDAQGSSPMALASQTTPGHAKGTPPNQHYLLNKMTMVGQWFNVVEEDNEYLLPNHRPLLNPHPNRLPPIDGVLVTIDGGLQIQPIESKIMLMMHPPLVHLLAHPRGHYHLLQLQLQHQLQL